MKTGLPRFNDSPFFVRKTQSAIHADIQGPSYCPASLQSTLHPYSHSRTGHPLFLDCEGPFLPWALCSESPVA